MKVKVKVKVRMKNTNKAFTILLFMLLLASTITAVPSSRSLKSSNEYISTQDLYHHFLQMKGRMAIELSDYTGTGANNHHDPSPPSPPTNS